LSRRQAREEAAPPSLFEQFCQIDAPEVPARKAHRTLRSFLLSFTGLAVIAQRLRLSLRKIGPIVCRQRALAAPLPASSLEISVDGADHEREGYSATHTKEDIGKEESREQADAEHNERQDNCLLIAVRVSMAAWASRRIEADLVATSGTDHVFLAWH
jgi:hypothetical protein